MSKRELKIGTKKYTTVFASDNPSHGNANHEYRVEWDKDNNGFISAQVIKFQKGPIKEFGVNGVTNEDLIAIVIDRMRGFQSGDYACRDNELALTKLEEALMWLRNRTNEREARGVEGTHEK